jgi:RNA polymerase-binding transcription factor DksA
MKKSRRVMRRAILSSLYAHLQDAYGVELAEDSFVHGQISIQDVDALLAFKSDPRIDELRGALDRLERGVFGQCLACKQTIDQELLSTDPTHRLCATCERIYSQAMTGEMRLSVSPVL